jgi:hypothetical protein
MRILRHLVSGGLGIAGFALGSPAMAVATPLAYSYTTSNSNLTLATSASLVGNKLQFATTVKVPVLTKNINMTIGLQASAWNATIDPNQYLLNANGSYKLDSAGKKITNTNFGKYVITKAIIGEYVGGLGVTSRPNDDITGSTCGIGDCMTHQVDNFGNTAASSSIDFIRLDFSQAVTLGSIQRTAYAAYKSDLSGKINDDDFSFGSGSNVTDGMVVSSLTGILTNNVGSNGQCAVVPSVNGCSDTSTVVGTPTTGTASTTWYIAASILTGKDANGKQIYGNDLLPDSFKLAKLNAYYIPPTYGHTGAVPEPSTWMTMIAGFGIAGAAMRRARRQKAALAA